MRMIYAAWVAAWVIGQFVCVAQAAEFPIRPVQASREEVLGSLGGYGAIARLQTRKPSAVKHEPDAVSAHPLYGSLIISGRQTDWVFRLDQSKSDSKGYDLLILDINRNGDLRDDPQAKAEDLTRQPFGTYEQVYFGPIDAGQKQGPWQPTLYAMALIYPREAIASAGNSSAFVGQLLLASGNYLETIVEAEGIRRRIAFRDANCNLRLGDKPVIHLFDAADGSGVRMDGGDVLLCDLDGSGKFDISEIAGESQPFTDLLYLGANPYTIRLAEDLTAVFLEPYNGATGELLVPTNSRVAQATFARKTAPEQYGLLVVDFSAGKAKVPVGDYRLIQCVVAGEAKDGAKIMTGSAFAASKTSLNVAERQSATVPMGAPISLRPEVEKHGSSSGLLRALLGGGQTVSISAKIVGAGGETYSTFMKFAKGKADQLDPPKFKVRTLDGKELASGQLEYG
ncbi:MAG: hypothetical protein N3D11_04185 [Candidatus Sumerlaeia bacterium]|nr:hypothetical protein [Candidatus Sumerlaeia bacterium]